MPVAPPSPLNAQHYAMLQDALKALNDAEAHVALAERAGIAFPKETAQIQDLKTKLRNIQQVYFPQGAP